MTDVTGFGLAGHLLNMLDASGVGAELLIDDVPVYPGARELLATGISSTLSSSNAAAVTGRIGKDGSDVDSILFDPQTAGGLLAAVPADEAPGLVKALRALGADASQIGEVTEGSPRIRIC